MSQPPTSSNIIEQQGPNQIVRIRSDSETNLDDLFKAVMHPKDSQVQLGVPMRLRKLPSSFFQQPDRGSKSASHSRESSADAGAYSPAAAPSSPTPPPPPGHPSGLPINHPRAHSSPATLQQTYNSNTTQHQHLRQHSYDITDELPLPPGWAMAKTATGQRYFLNHFTKTTTWEDPRKKLLAAAVAANAAANANNNNNNNNNSGSSNNPTSTSSTSGSAGSSPSPISSSSLSPQPQSTSASSPSNNSNNSTSSPSNPSTTSSSTSTGSATLREVVSLGPLPDGWEQATTASGETYFINHIECTTSWFDPRISVHLQRAPLVQGQANTPQLILSSQPNNQNQQTVVLGSTNGVSMQQASLQQRQQKLRLQRLQLERERLKIRQQEILRQAACLGNPMLNEMVLRRSLGEEMATSPPPSDQSVTGVDPFLSGSSDYHSRQESADSGLGLGPNYSLPHTPEDFLSNMDDSVDTIGDDSVQTVGDLGLDSLQTSSLDLGAGENMDSDDLVPSLQEELTADILPDIEALLSSNKDNVLTWL